MKNSPIIVGAGLAAAYAALAVFGLNWAVVPGAGSPVWPAAGVAVAGLFLWGLRLWPAIFIGRLAAALIVDSPQPLWADAAIALGNAGAAALGVWLAKRTEVSDLQRLRGLVRYLAYGGAVSSAAAATVGAAVLYMAGSLSPDHVAIAWTGWAIGNFVGATTVGVLMISWRQADGLGRDVRRLTHLGLVLVCTAGAAVAVFLDDPGIPRGWLIFPTLAWAAIGFNLRGAALALVIAGGIALWGTVNGTGPFGAASLAPAMRASLLQEFLAVAAITVLFLAVGSQERRESEALRRSEAWVRRVLDQLFAFVAITDLSGRTMQVNQAPLKALGITSDDVVGRYFWDSPWCADEDLRERLHVMLEAAARGEVVRDDIPAVTADGQVRIVDVQVSALRDERGAITHLIPTGIDVTDRKRTEEQLREVDLRLQAVLNNASVAIILTDAAQRCAYMNAAAERLTGFSIAEAAGRPAHQILHGGGEPDACAVCAGLAAGALRGEDVYVHKHGQRTPVAFTAGPIHDEAAGLVGTIIEARDISAEKRSEQARNLLMREVDHRARNALAVVQSLVQLTEGEDLDRYKQNLMGRITALARAQGSLAERRWEGAELRQLLSEEFTTFAGLDRLELDGPDVMLTPQQVQPLSMIVHELRTNAAKYGALSAEGRVQVCWRREPDGGLRLVWQETGGPPVEAPHRLGFGSRLIRGLARQLNAKAAFSWRPDGLVFRLTMPGRDGPGPQEGADRETLAGL